MANCKEYSDLLPIEKRDYIGSLIHACTNDSDLFLWGQTLIKKAIKKGLFDGVKINPDEREINLSTENTEQ